jgi:putative transposase
MKVPADVSTRSGRPYRGLEELAYPFHDATFTVTQCGRICFKARKVNLSYVFAGQNVGVTQVGERVWLVTFMRYDLGYFDDETCRLEPIENPFTPKLLPMSQAGMKCYLCLRNGPSHNWFRFEPAFYGHPSTALICCAEAMS